MTSLPAITTDASARPVRTVDLEIPFAPLTGLCELVIVRHGEQEQSAALALGLDADPPLSARGRQQAEAVGDRLASGRVDAVYSSPLLRAADTARAIGRHHGIEPTLMEELVEFDLWYNLPPGTARSDAVTEEQRLAILAEFDETRRIDAFPFAEDRHAFRARVAAAFDDLVRRHIGQRVVAVCHSGVVSAYLGTVLGVDRDVIVRVHHSSLNVFRSDGHRRAVLVVNDHAHVLAFQDSVTEHFT
jgi:2,3-bisphosphoglycerate-dependent phosphoglycerate mutase